MGAQGQRQTHWAHSSGRLSQAKRLHPGHRPLLGVVPRSPTQDAVPGTTADEAPARKVVFLWWEGAGEVLHPRGAGWGGRWGPQSDGPITHGSDRQAGSTGPGGPTASSSVGGGSCSLDCLGQGSPQPRQRPQTPPFALEASPASLSLWTRGPAPQRLLPWPYPVTGPLSCG